MSVREDLIAARAFIERGWTRICRARDSAGAAIDPKSDRAVCWCVTGAIEAAVPDDDKGGETFLVHGVCVTVYPNTHERVLAATRALKAIIRPESLFPLGRWNDVPGRARAEVLAVFDRAIEVAT